MRRVFLFDIDGTILLTGGAGSRALNRIMEERHQIGSAMDVVRAGGMTDPAILEQMYRHHLGRNPDGHEVEYILAAYPPLLEQELASGDGFRTMPGAIAAIQWLARQAEVSLGIATGNIRATADIKLRHAGVDHFFAYGGYGDDSPIRSELVATAVERAKLHLGGPVDPDQVVVVGDTPHDITAARACGVRVLAVPTGSFDRDTLRACEPDWLLDTLEQLPAWYLES